MTTYLFSVSDWIRAIKEFIDVPVVVGGVHLSIYARETLGYPEIDYAVTGEAERALPDLLNALVKKEDLSLVRGIAFKQHTGSQDRQVIVTPRASDVIVDEAPFPARQLIDNSIYYSFISKYKNFSVFITSRGCPYKCIFCEQGSKAFRPRSPKNVVDELELCVNDSAFVSSILTVFHHPKNAQRILQ